MNAADLGYTHTLAVAQLACRVIPVSPCSDRSLLAISAMRNATRRREEWITTVLRHQKDEGRKKERSCLYFALSLFWDLCIASYWTCHLMHHS